jgi:predicted TIM-barrel fold metal-dependent hydrolase
LGFVGVEVAAHYGNFYLDDKMFRPYLKKLNELNVPVIVHHTPMPADYHNLYDYKNQCMIMGRCVDQMTAIGRELYSGLFDECPNLRCIHTCLGGGIFALSDFIMPRVSPTKEEIERYDSASLQKVGEQFRNNIFYDTTSPNAWGKIQMECAIKVLGADHILYAASYPVRLDWVFNSPNFMDNLDITEEEKELIFSGNAKRLFNLK